MIIWKFDVYTKEHGKSKAAFKDDMLVSYEPQVGYTA